MAKLTKDEIVTLQVLRERGESNTAIANRLGITEGAVRYHVRRAKVQAIDGRQKDFLIERLGLQEVVKQWRETTTESLPDGRPPNVQSLWAYLVDEHQYSGSYKSVRRYVRENVSGSEETTVPSPTTAMRRCPTAAGCSNAKRLVGSHDRHQRSRAAEAVRFCDDVKPQPHDGGGVEPFDESVGLAPRSQRNVSPFGRRGRGESDR